MSSAMDSRKWGDQDDEQNGDIEPIVTERGPDENGVYTKTITEFKTNEKGQRVKVVKTIKRFQQKVRINKRVEERKKWRKFGEAAGAPPGPEKGITTLGDEVILDFGNQNETPEAGDKGQEVTKLGIICRHCGQTGDHWTLKCPFKDKIPELTGQKKSNDQDSAPSSGGPGKYVPPSLRAGAKPPLTSSRDSMDSDRRGGSARDETATIRVTNLSEETKESDLMELFRAFGQISRIYLAKDKVTNLSKGFAFINFVHREDAAKAIERLSGFGYGHLILHVEWAKPSNK